MKAAAAVPSIISSIRETGRNDFFAMPAIKKVTSLMTSLLFLVWTTMAMPGATMRDLRKYEIRSYDFAPLKAGDWSAMRRAARAFLWSHWQHRKLGVLIVKSYTKEGSQKKSTYFVEPGTTGEWKIEISEQHEVIGSGQRNSTEKRFPVYGVEKISTKILFKNKRGELLGSW